MSDLYVKMSDLEVKCRWTVFKVLAFNLSLPVNAYYTLINAINKPAEITLLNEHLPILKQENNISLYAL